MADIRRLTDSFAAAPQITASDIAGIKAAGFGFIVNNRPDGESADQTPGDDIEAAALEAGLGYCAIPIDQSGFTVEQVAALSALMVSPRPILAYCRSGTRSTNLWALAAASRGEDVETIIDSALTAGYDVRALRPAMEQLAALS
ncbi:TIGR01244 family phosphatase [Sandaracinobacter neustonicus]|uniref:TIGR01244 family phosphatase n=1 Tax=Sandaracinobacter neustonicus TaxID=1715348 RepID=A0A501XML6_9SPHN|nr:TIGR01244 family sulfur transferase [Sandaracinobacter neustonicus]TPE61830.1 TIGR01244 family phosphatase [Sandaracinobacter neustonicus]